MQKITGVRIGSGRNTTVYNHRYDPSKVILMGDYDRDLFKLAAYAKINALYAIQKNGNDYSAIVARMDTGENSPTIMNTLRDMCMLTDDICNAHNSTNDRAMLNDFSNRLDDLGKTIVALFSLILDGCDHLWFDNCNHNWLYWQDQAIPIDVFDPEFAGISLQSHAILESMIDSYIQE